MNTTSYANSVFEQPWWLDLVAPGEWGEVFVREEGEVVARMPYKLHKGKICMPTLTQTLGPWIHEKYRQYQPGNTQLSKQKEIIAQLLEQLPTHHSFLMTFDSSNDYILPYRWQGFRYEPTFSYRIGDLSNIEAVYANLNKTAKKNIKYAKNKTTLVEHPTAEMMMSLVEKSFEAQGRRLPGHLGQGRQLIESAIANQAGKLIIAQDPKGNLHSGAFLLYDEIGCYYLLGGSDAAYRSSGAQSLVLWESIQFAAANSKWFDFEGSNVEGIENFFRQFGGTRVTNYVVSKQPFGVELISLLKPRIKRLLGYKI